MSEIVIASFGDLLINREIPGSVFQHLAPLFAEADVIIGNYEGVLTDTPQPIAGRRGTTLSSVTNAQGLGAFSVLSLANNHALDSGTGGLKDTLAAMASIGVQTTGAGLSYQDAWRPVYIDCQGVRIAVFGVAGVFRAGTEANAWQGGVAAIRSRDYYAAPFNGAIVPGVLPDVHTQIEEDDWQYFAGLIAEARDQAELIIALTHWGDHRREYVVTGFESEIARRMADAGVDVIIGHHHHQMRGFQWHQQTLTCYGLGNAVFDQPRMSADGTPEGTGFLLADNARYSAVVITRYQQRSLISAHLLPLFITEDTPIPIVRDSDEWHKFLDIQAHCARESQFPSLVVDRHCYWNNFALLDLKSSDE